MGFQTGNPAGRSELLTRLFITLLVIFTISVFVARIRLGTALDIGSLYTKIQGLIVVAIVLLHSVIRTGWKRAGVFALAAFLVPSLTEMLGVSRGFVFGAYAYTDQLGFRLLPGIPLYISLAWYVTAYFGLQAAAAVMDEDRAFESWKGVILFSILSAVACTAWDLFLDPVCVVLGAWKWEVPGGYFGIPAVNFAGWLGTAFLLYVVYASFSRILPEGVRRLSPFLRHLPLAVIIFFTHFLVLLCLLHDLPGPAFCGWAVQMSIVLLALRRTGIGAGPRFNHPRET